MCKVTRHSWICHKRRWLADKKLLLGDLVFVLPGFEMPLLARGVKGDDGEGRYHLVGPCYMHGIMDLKTLPKDHTTERVEIV
jgi:hypothetical protein